MAIRRFPTVKFPPLPKPQKPPKKSFTPAKVINDAVKEKRLVVAGEGSLLRELYGHVRPMAQIATPVVDGNDDLLLLCVWGLGPIQSILNVYVGDTAVSSINRRNYLGTNAQLADPWLSAAISGYADTLQGIAYSVVKIPAAGELNSRIWADIMGRNDIFDPRTDGTGYSDNPALCMANFVDRYTPPIIGVDWDSITPVANFNDGLVTGIKRRMLSLVMDQAMEIDRWVDLLSEYAGCYVKWDGGDFGMALNHTKTTLDGAYGVDKIRAMRIRKRGLSSNPNRVHVMYTDKTGGFEWKTGRATYPPLGTTIPGELREQTISMPGIPNYAQAYRLAEERVNYYQTIDIEGEIDVYDEGLRATAGDVLSVLHPRLGFDGERFRVLETRATEPGRWTLVVERYENIYSNSAPTAPTLEDIDYPF